MQCNNALERIVNHRGRTVHAMKHRLLRVAICAQGLMGCKNVDVAECTEDVQLSDGRNILVFTAGQCARQWLSQCEKGRRYRQFAPCARIGPVVESTFALTIKSFERARLFNGMAH